MEFRLLVGTNVGVSTESRFVVVKISITGCSHPYGIWILQSGSYRSRNNAWLPGGMVVFIRLSP